MLTMSEKVCVLRTVSLFHNTPDEILAHVTDIVEEVTFPAGSVIMHKGDLGTCMYIIVNGKVRVHDGEQTLNVLGRADVFGEMALLDPEPRIATITALEETELFRLDKTPFDELISRRFEVVQGIIEVLCMRLRDRVRDSNEDFKYIQQVGALTSAAVKVERGVYDAESLDHVAMRRDELGQLARVFQTMLRNVEHRERQLKQEVQDLRIEIDHARKARQVAEITDSDYFRELKGKVNLMKNRAKEK